MKRLKKASIEGIFGEDDIRDGNNAAYQLKFDLSNDDKAFLNVYHDALDDMVYASLQLEDGEGRIIDLCEMCTSGTHEQGIDVFRHLKEEE